MGLDQGHDTVTETPPPGSFQTTVNPAPITIDTSGKVITDAEVKELAFGNAFEGSIHGFTFDDRNADGVWDTAEPPLKTSLSPRGGPTVRALMRRSRHSPMPKANTGLNGCVQESFTRS